jgi:signal transduction histidine kinase
MVGLYSTKQLFFLAISLIATMIILLFIFQKLRNEQKENERKGLAFRILSHELRTPIASLLLRIDGIIKKIQNYSDQEQIELLKLSSDIHRLHRLSEMSKHYLTVNSGEKLIKLNYKKIDSAERFFDSFIDEFEDLDYSFEGDDFEFYSDPFWLNICIKNLLKNAYMHGQRPVKLKVLKTKKHKLSITVEDQGEPEFDKLGEMLKEFNKSSKSEGSGLGLNIVYKVLRIMKGKIEFLRSPTRFIVEIGIGNDRESITD